jgi:hypothetical protein
LIVHTRTGIDWDVMTRTFALADPIRAAAAAPANYYYPMEAGTS